MTDRPIIEVTYEEAMSRFRGLLTAEKLPTKPVASARWYVTDVSVGALVLASKTTARIKATATLPEWRGYGYGDQMLRHLIDEARRHNRSQIEVYTEQPGWYYRNGFEHVRTAPWGTLILVAPLTPVTPLD